jgi:hypothetical protein
LFICLLYVAISAHCLACIIAVSREINTAHRVRDRVANGVTVYRAEGRRVITDDGAPLPAGRIIDYIRNLVLKADKQGRERRLDQTLLLRGLADKLGSPMQFGAFAGDALLKLGLLGTIVGFILMLFPLATLENFDAASMKSSMKVMSGGMAVAMYTTLAGLVGSILVKAQYHSRQCLGLSVRCHDRSDRGVCRIDARAGGAWRGLATGIARSRSNLSR